MVFWTNEQAGGKGNHFKNYSALHLSVYIKTKHRRMPFFGSVQLYLMLEKGHL